MALSRPFLLALLGAALLGATYFAVQNARDTAAVHATPVAEQPQSQPAAPGFAQTPRPEQAIASSFDGLKSGRFEVQVSARAAGQSGKLRLTGAFAGASRDKVGRWEIHLKANAGAKLDLGMVSLEDAGFILAGNKAYRVPPAAWNRVRDYQRGHKGSVALAVLPQNFKLQNWLRNAKSEPGRTIHGVETTHVSASLDVPAVLRDVAKLTKQGGQGVPRALPANVEKMVGDAVKKADLDLYVGKDDKILRRAEADLQIAPPNGRPISIKAELNLTDVNKPQKIVAPAHVVRGLPGAGEGALADTILQGIGGVDRQGPNSLAALASNNPQKAARAVRAGKKVVILFRNPNGLDDRLMVRVMSAVARRTNAVMLVDSVDTVERYGKLVEDLGVSETPSVVIIGRSGKARLLEGYVDSDTLAQAVADVR